MFAVYCIESMGNEEINSGLGERDMDVYGYGWYEKKRKKQLSSHIICLLESHRQT